MAISVQKIRDDFEAGIAKFAGMAITATVGVDVITSAVMSQKQKKTNELLDEGESNEIERWLRFKYDDVTTVPVPNDTICTISAVDYLITEVMVDSVNATIRIKIEDEFADL